MLVMGFVLLSCTDEDLSAYASSEDQTEAGGVYVNFDIAGYPSSAYTRSSSTTETGWDGRWKENALDHLSILIFERGDWKYYVVRTVVTTTTAITTTDVTYYADGTSKTTYSSSEEYTSEESEVGTTTTTTYSYNYTLKYYHTYTGTPTVGEQWQLTDDDGNKLRESYISDTDSIFLVANYDFSTDTDIYPRIQAATEEDYSGNTDKLTIDYLKEYSTTTYLTASDQTTESGLRTKQTGGFSMDGAILGSEAEITRNPDDYGEETKILNISLRRALAKICLRIKYKAVDASSYTQLDDFASNGISLQVMNYATKAYLMSDGHNEDGDATVDVEPTSVELTDENEYSSTVNFFPLTTSASDYSEADDADEISTYYETYKDDPRAVFYVFPNNWYDSSKKIITQQPIYTERQTHIMMSVTSTHIGGSTYYYKVPINYLLPEYNDEKNPDESYKELYRVDRNHVYNVTVYVEETYNGFRVTLDDTDDTIIDDLEESDTDITITY